MTPVRAGSHPIKREDPGRRMCDRASAIQIEGKKNPPRKGEIHLGGFRDGLSRGQQLLGATSPLYARLLMFNDSSGDFHVYPASLPVCLRTSQTIASSFDFSSSDDFPHRVLAASRTTRDAGGNPGGNPGRDTGGSSVEQAGGDRDCGADRPGDAGRPQQESIRGHIGGASSAPRRSPQLRRRRRLSPGPWWPRWNLVTRRRLKLYFSPVLSSRTGLRRLRERPWQ